MGLVARFGYFSRIKKKTYPYQSPYLVYWSISVWSMSRTPAASSGGAGTCKLCECRAVGAEFGYLFILLLDAFFKSAFRIP